MYVLDIYSQPTVLELLRTYMSIRRPLLCFSLSDRPSVDTGNYITTVLECRAAYIRKDLRESRSVSRCTKLISRLFHVGTAERSCRDAFRDGSLISSTTRARLSRRISRGGADPSISPFLLFSFSLGSNDATPGQVTGSNFSNVLAIKQYIITSRRLRRQGRNKRRTRRRTGEEMNF